MVEKSKLLTIMIDIRKLYHTFAPEINTIKGNFFFTFADFLAYYEKGFYDGLRFYLWIGF